MSHLPLSNILLDPTPFSLRVDSITDNSTTAFDLFISLSDHLVLYSGPGYRWCRRELTDLLYSGYEELFFRRQDVAKVRMYEAISKLEAVNELQPPTSRLQTIVEIGSDFTRCLYAGELSLDCVRKAEELATNVVDCISEEPSCIEHLKSLENHHYYTYYHSVRVAAYATAIAIIMGQTNRKQLEAIALGGIFHDIGKKEISDAILNKSGALTEYEWKVVKKHPENGFATLSNMNFNHISREIVLHHHEKLNGGGYPHGLDKTSLLTEVQIASTADIFDALTSKRTYQCARTKYEALDFIKHKFIGEAVSVDTFKALVQCLSS